MISPTEMAIQSAITEQFIAADFDNLALIPRSRIKDGAGGYKTVVGPARAVQKLRLIPQNDKVPEQKTSDGIFAQPEFMLLGMPDAAMERWDRFVWQGSTWEVTQIHEKPEYESKGDVVRVV